MNRVASDLEAAQRALGEGRIGDAFKHYQDVLDKSAEHPVALNSMGNIALSNGSPLLAADFFRRAVVVDPDAAPIWLNLAFALRCCGQDAEELEALERALIADPYLLVALLNKAQWFERHSRADDAVRTYRGLLSAAPPPDQLPDAMRALLAHGQALVQAADDRIDHVIRRALESRDIRSDRFLHCLDVLAGRRKIYVSQPAGLHFPYLPAIQFFDRRMFPWFVDLEAATGVIRDELIAAIQAGASNSPYVRIAAGQPVNQWRALNHSPDWGALFLWKDGAPVKEAVARCPRTAEIVGALPLFDVPGRGPTVMFSTLAPGSHIPPHNGVTNTRAVVHLPLIVPLGCMFRVGSETREWQEGVAWAFDDTIEHEAWNNSDEARVILIIDAWNPYLDEEERELLKITNQVLTRPDMIM